ncbi:Leucine zipper putative tumor suppressor 3 [Trichinella britovi]|uniref:Leucine zipper putative tumor suppressor 3 n=1 Tax=Trichinella britovi TaxID=45882 RepID=A0A0V1D992_TRIBR|nr:Leucine zipper putative tumor suppressor 3 [Trichinella britovi]
MSTDSGGFVPSPHTENCQQQQVPKAPPRRRHAWKKFLLSLGRLTSAIDTGAFVSTCPRIRMSTTCATVDRHYRRAGSAPTSVNRYAPSVQHQWNQVSTWAGRRRRLQQHFKLQTSGVVQLSYLVPQCDDDDQNRCAQHGLHDECAFSFGKANTVAADSEPTAMGLLRMQNGEARRATWLWQSNGDLSVVNLPQTVRTDHLDKPYYSMNNLTEPDGVGSVALLKMEPTPRGWVKLENANRVASVEPMYTSAEQHAEVQSARGPFERQRPHMRGRRPCRPPALYTGSAWDVRPTTAAGEQQQLATKKSTYAQSSDGVKTSGKKSAFVRGLCDLASVERLRQWKAKLPLKQATALLPLFAHLLPLLLKVGFVCFRRRAEKTKKRMSLLHDVRNYLSLRNCTRRPARRFQHHPTGRHSAASMGEEGNYDVPVTPNRLEATTTEKEEACLRSARLVNACAYYNNNNNNSQWQEAKRHAAHTRQASAPLLGQAVESATSSSSSAGDPSLLQQSRCCYFVPSYASEPRSSAYDNAETLMATRKIHCAASTGERRPQLLEHHHSAQLHPQQQQQQQHHHHHHHQASYQQQSQKSNLYRQDSGRLPPPSRLVAFGGVPNSTDHKNLVKPSAFRPVQSTVWQTVRAAPVEAVVSLDNTKSSSANPVAPLRFPVGDVEKSSSSPADHHPHHYPQQQQQAGEALTRVFVSTAATFIAKPNVRNGFGNSTSPRLSEINGGDVVPSAEATENSNQMMHHASNSCNRPDRIRVIPVEEYDTEHGSQAQKVLSGLSSPMKNSRKEMYEQAAGMLSSYAYNSQPSLAGAEHGNGHSQHRHSASRSSRNSSGIQVTPSPSDSVVTELETALREKDAEILNLRTTMERNEEVIIQVYQEKEERWNEKLREWGSRLQAAVRNEQKLLSQVHYMQDERSDFQEKINSLVAEKQGLQKKVIIKHKIRQLEKEMFELRGRLNAKVKQWSVCQKCSNVFLPQQNQVESGSPHSTDMLRSELDALRLEVTEIRHSLQGQVG